MSAHKKLRQSTIISKELYVERAADRQLMSVVDEMGRPAYILVARQMGKTNMLINMKRQRPNDVVLYLDLSNRFDSLRLWFRHVIDYFSESYPDLFGPVYAEIIRQRMEKDIEANVEYDRHLRLLLGAISGNIIIVLDEIDSLVNAPYSDSILAQIRSMYFSRTNFPVYERLTYVLSGVIEPGDLIKDKNISPFNIGEKIYLEDFSFEEVSLFLEKAEIKCDAEIVKAIYDWTGGSPRVTWDICSELEDHLSNGKVPTVQLIDNIVNRLYLISFDRAPVDHIRTLVESDSLVRDSIVSIRYGKSAYVSDKAKSHLYLAGITRVCSNGQTVIKNRLVDSVLSDEWLDQIANTKVAVLKSAEQYWKSGDYGKAKDLFDPVFKDSTFSDLIPVEYRYGFAHCCQSVGDLSRALAEFLKCHDAVREDATMRQDISLSIAYIYMHCEDFEKSVDYLREAEIGPDRKKRSRAQISLMTALAHVDYQKYADEEISQGKALVNRLDCEDCVGDAENCELLISAIFNVAVLQMSKSDFVGAQEMFEAALSKSPAEYVVAIILKQYDLPQLKDIRRQLVSRAADLVIDNDLPINNLGSPSIKLNIYDFADLLIRAKDENLTSHFERLATYFLAKKNRKLGICEALLEIYQQVAPKGKTSRYIGLLEVAATSYFQEDVTVKNRLQILRIISSMSRSPKVSEWEIAYVVALGEVNEDDIDGDEDYYALAKIAISLFNKKSYKTLRSVFSLAHGLRSRCSTEAPSYWFVLLDYCEMEFFSINGQLQRAKQIAVNILKLAEKMSDTSEDDEDLLPQIVSRAKALTPKTPIKVSRDLQHGRNERVSVRYHSTKEVVVKKYKYLEDDLKDGLCELIEDN